MCTQRVAHVQMFSIQANTLHEQEIKLKVSDKTRWIKTSSVSCVPLNSR